jgi:hypothetical protein
LSHTKVRLLSYVKSFGWNLSRISILEVEAVPQRRITCRRKKKDSVACVPPFCFFFFCFFFVRTWLCQVTSFVFLLSFRCFSFVAFYFHISHLLFVTLASFPLLLLFRMYWRSRDQLRHCCRVVEKRILISSFMGRKQENSRITFLCRSVSSYSYWRSRESFAVDRAKEAILLTYHARNGGRSQAETGDMGVKLG